jgi:hypothetical protein
MKLLQGGWGAGFGLALMMVCGGCDESTTVVVDEGVLCFHATDGANAFEAGAPVTVGVELDECLSSSCDVDREAFCEVEVGAGEIVVHAEFGWTDTGDSTCTTDCGSLVAECTSAPLPAGDYEVRFGSVTYTTFAVPEDGPSYCFGY